MYNPLVPNLSKLKNDDLENKVTELMKKYLIAAKSGQSLVCSQILTILEMFREEQNKRYIAANQKLINEENKNFEDYINIDR